MPLSTVCVSTVSSRPRTWSSYSNIRAKDVQDLINMNATEEIAVYKDSNELYQSPTLARRTLGYSYDFPEKSPKKEKKWSISSIFRRKKKDESDSSSEEESQKKGFLGRRRKKSDGKRKKHVKTVGTFDHVVVPPAPRNSLIYNGYNNCQEDKAVLSDPTGGFSNYVGRPLPQTPNDSNQKFSRESLNDLNNSRVSLGLGSVDSVARKSRREQAKARAEARRTSSRNASSSDEDSQRSNSSLKIRSEENLSPRDSSFSKKSRAARTERYFKRHSKDGENPHNYLRLSKSDAENSVMNWKQSDDSNRSPSRSPLVPSPVILTNAKNNTSYTNSNPQNINFSGLSTIPPSHNIHSRFRVSNSTSNSSYKPPQSMNDYNNSTKKSLDSGKYFPDQRSISCDANIHKAPSAEFTEEILNVQFPIVRPNRGFRNLSLIDPAQFKVRQPPPPPPRDPNRMMGAHFFESGRPTTYYFDNTGQSKSKSFSNSNPNPVLQQTRKFSSFNLHPSFRSTSEDHLPRETLNVQLAARPSSTTPDSGKPQRYITRRNEIGTNPEDFNYLTDKKPRSRKPIFIQSGTKSLDNNTAKTEATGSQKALNFWKQIDRQNVNVDNPILRKTRPNSPQIFTSHTRVQTKVFLPSVLHNDMNNSNEVLLNDNRSSSPFKPVTPTLQEVTETPGSTEEQVSKEEIKRKSSNLEEALDELEAIYNSLRLGDDDLLERAEQREKESQAKKHLQAHVDAYPNYSARGALSDSSFSYEPFDSVDSPRRRRMIRKNRTVDVKQDDMAFRKLNKERASTISDPQSVISKVSYLQASPVHGRNVEEEEGHNCNEPDTTFDDVVYRNVKHANNALKVIDPQPPFGIPLGPITPAANSDYLHAKPENIYRPIFKHKKIPDIVKDDLAFRNLRKDGNKGPALPPLSTEDYKNNNSDNMNYLRKKRAQRSLSANIGSLIHNEIIDKAKSKHKTNNNDVDNEFKTLTDIADAMEIARRVLKEKENKITATKKAFMSDTDTPYIHSISNSTKQKEDRLSFLNGLKASSREAKPSSPRLSDNVLLSKPPRGLTPEIRRSPKESTPIPVSPLEDKKSANSESTSSSLDDLLNALAEEAKETTDRITNELKMLTEETEKRSNLKRDEVNDKEKNEELNKQLLEIDAVSEHAKLCEKLLECVVDSTALMTSTKATEEVVEEIDEKPEVSEAANVVLNRIDSKEEKEVKEESDHDYENLISDKELNVDEVDVTIEETKVPEKCQSPFEEHKQELVASFQELKENIDNIELPFKRDNPESKATEKETPSKVDSVYENLDNAIDESKGVTGEEACAGVFDIVALPIRECAFTINANHVDREQMFTSNCDIILRKPNNFNLHEDSETSSGFHSNCSCGDSSHYVKFDDFGSSNNLDSLESLKSPKLVLETSQKVSSCRVTESDGDCNFPKSPRLVMEVSQANKARTENQTGNNSRAGNSRPNSRHILDGDGGKPTPSWYRDPTTVAFACSYGLACAHQLASIDLFAILGILFAVISFIAALFL